MIQAEVLHLSEITRFSNGYDLATQFTTVLHLSEITRFSNLYVDEQSSIDVLHLSEITRFSNGNSNRLYWKTSFTLI